MRVQAMSAAVAGARAPAARRTAGAAFTVAEAEGARTPSPVARARTIGGVDALIALQAFDDPRERRRRAVRHGQSALDVLEELKIGVLAGVPDPATLARLKGLRDGLAEDSGDPGLNAVLAEIELRAAVELAKFSRR